MYLLVIIKDIGGCCEDSVRWKKKHSHTKNELKKNNKNKHDTMICEMIESPQSLVNIISTAKLTPAASNGSSGISNNNEKSGSMTLHMTQQFPIPSNSVREKNRNETNKKRRTNDQTNTNNNNKNTQAQPRMDWRQEFFLDRSSSSSSPSTSSSSSSTVVIVTIMRIGVLIIWW